MFNCSKCGKEVPLKSMLGWDDFGIWVKCFRCGEDIMITGEGMELDITIEELLTRLEVD